MERTPRKSRARYVVFGIGAAVGSALGLILGSLLTFWIGDETLQAVRRLVRRATRGGDHPDFETLLQ